MKHVCVAAVLPAAVAAMATSALSVLLSVPAFAATANAGNLVMGTVLQVRVTAATDEQARNLTQRAIEIARHWENVLTTWRPDGELAQLNRAAGKGPVPVSPWMAYALDRMHQLWRDTGGAFDPAVGRTVHALREGRSSPDRHIRFGDAVTRDGAHVSLAKDVAIDAGGIGKGIALDAMAHELREAGAQAAYLDFGGSSQLAFGPATAAGHATASGHDDDERRMVLAGATTGRFLGTVVLDNASLSTSRATAGDDEVGAIVDPATGTAILPPFLATVRAADATTAEAWSTALIVVGPAGLSAAESHGVSVILDDGRNVRCGGDWTGAEFATSRICAPTARMNH